MLGWMNFGLVQTFVAMLLIVAFVGLATARTYVDHVRIAKVLCQI
jgi:hypothetical protein